MYGNQVLRATWRIGLVAILISPGFFWLHPKCEAQNKAAPADYDYYSLAITSILTSAAEASKLPDVPQRVKLLIYAAKILPAAQHDEAVRLLELALRNVKEWGSEDKASWGQRNTAASLRNEVIVLYSVLDPQRAAVLQKESQAVESTGDDSSGTYNKNKDWFTQFRDREAIADRSARVALSLVDTNFDEAKALVVQSLQGGIVSAVLFQIVQKLIQNGNRELLNGLEVSIGQAMAANVTYHWSSLSYAAAIVQSDQEMPPLVRIAFVDFLTRSLQAWSSLVSDPTTNTGIDPSYINSVFTRYLLSVRPVVLQYSPERLLAFDLALNQVAPMVPEKTKSQLQAFQPEKFSEPRDRLNDILKDSNPERRDLRLIGLVSQLLRAELEDFEKNLDLTTAAIGGFSDPDTKAAYTDRLLITRVNHLVEKKKFIEAQRLARSISSEETRAWALLALSTVAAKADRVLGFELISNALTALDKASPSPHKVELALIATAMLTKNDPQRAFDTLSAVSRYANSSASKVDPPTKPPVAFGLEVTIGDAKTRLGVFPETLGELEINPSVAALGTIDWFRSEQIVNDIREPALRLRLKLQFAQAMLASNSKPKQKDGTTAAKQEPQ